MPVITVKVMSAADDGVAITNAGGSSYGAETDLMMGTYDVATKIESFMRFESLPIPKGAVINSAYLRVFSYGDDQPLVAPPSNSWTLAAHANDNRNVPALAASIGSGLTTANAIWQPTVSVGNWAQSPDIKAIISEVITRSGWLTGNAILMVWRVTGNYLALDMGQAYFSAYDEAGLSHAPELVIDYTAPSSVIIPGLLSLWKCNEVSAGSSPVNRIDSIGGQIAVDSAAGCASVASGVSGYGNAVQLASTEYMEVEHRGMYCPGDVNFGAYCRVKLPNTTSTQQLLCKTTQSPAQRQWRLDFVNTTSRFRFAVSNNGTAETIVTSTVVPVANTWYLVIGEHDAVNNKIRIYVNGTMTEAAFSSGVARFDTPLRIGRRGSSEYSSAIIDSIGFFHGNTSADDRTFLAASAEGAQTFTGTGGIAAGVTTLGGVGDYTGGVVTHTGAGGVAAGPTALAGTGTHERTFGGTGGVAAGPTETEGEGGVTGDTFSGAGGITAGTTELAGAGTHERTFGGTGGVATGPTETGGAGGIADQVFTGSGGIAVASAIAGAGTHERTFGGTGGVATGPTETGGAGETADQIYTGTGGIAADTTALAGTGTHERTFGGAGGVETGPTGTGGAGDTADQVYSGSGGLTVPATLAGTGTHKRTFGGTGGVTVEPTETGGAGDHEAAEIVLTGTGGIVATAVALDGDGELSNVPDEGLDGLEACWPLNEVSDGSAPVARLDAVGSQHAVDIGNILSVPGFTGNGARFANSKYFEVAHSATFNPLNGSFAWYCRVKLPNVTSSQHLICKTVQGSHQQYRLDFSSGNQRFRFAVSANGTADVIVSATTFGLPVAGVWYLVIGEYDALLGKIRIYVNNIGNEANHSTGIHNWTEPVRFGRRSASEFSSCDIDSIGFLRRATTPEDRALLLINGEFGGGGEPETTFVGSGGITLQPTQLAGVGDYTDRTFGGTGGVATQPTVVDGGGDTELIRTGAGGLTVEPVALAGTGLLLPAFEIVYHPAGRQGIGVTQGLHAPNYPFVQPSADISHLLAEFQLIYDDPAMYNGGTPLQPPFRVAWLFGLGNWPSALPDGLPAPTHAVDVRIVDAADELVFDSTIAEEFFSRDWGDRLKLYGWRTGAAACQLVAHTAWGPGDTPTGYQLHITPANGDLDHRTIQPMPRRVTAFNALLTHVQQGALELVAGYNAEFVHLGRSSTLGGRSRQLIGIAFEAGGGLGRYPGCEEVEREIHTINGVGPNAFGDFLLDAHDCYYVRRPLTRLEDDSVVPSTDEIPLAAHLRIGNNCKPCCDCSDYETTARYMNTVRDEYMLVAGQVSEARETYHANRERWLTNRDCRLDKQLRLVLQAQVCPYLEVGLQFCNQTAECKNNVNLEVAFSLSPEGAPAPSIGCDSTVIKTAFSSAEAYYSLGGDWPTYTAHWDAVNPFQSVHTRFRLKFPNDGLVDEVPYTITAVLSGNIGGVAMTSVGRSVTLRCPREEGCDT